MNIYLLSNDKKITSIWSLYFEKAHDVRVVCDDLGHFMDTMNID